MLCTGSCVELCRSLSSDAAFSVTCAIRRAACVDSECRPTSLSIVPTSDSSRKTKEQVPPIGGAQSPVQGRDKRLGRVWGGPYRRPARHYPTWMASVRSDRDKIRWFSSRETPRAIGIFGDCKVNWTMLNMRNEFRVFGSSIGRWALTGVVHLCHQVC